MHSRMEVDDMCEVMSKKEGRKEAGVQLCDDVGEGSDEAREWWKPSVRRHMEEGETSAR